MKKLRLDFKNFNETEILSREQLKKIIGGDTSLGGSGCSVGQKCWNEFMQGYGVCMISAYGCQCLKYGVYAWSYDCEA